MTWDYPTKGPLEEPDAEAVLQEINGYTVGDRKLVDGFTELKDDGSTACGCWIYSGCFKDGVNQTARRKPHWEQNWVAPEWAWAWPHNRRMLYNRASADPEGSRGPSARRMSGGMRRSRSGPGTMNPTSSTNRLPTGRTKMRVERKPFGGRSVHHAVGRKGWIYVPSGLQDGPLPTHYEPQESVLKNPLYGQQCNPSRMEWMRDKDNPYHQPYDDPRFPYILTTYRLTEHHTAGGMSRWLSWLSEFSRRPSAKSRRNWPASVGLKNGGWATLRTRARRNRGAGARDEPPSAAEDSTAASCTRLACRTTGPARAWFAATVPTSYFRSLPTRTCRSWKRKPSRR